MKYTLLMIGSALLLGACAQGQVASPTALAGAAKQVPQSTISYQRDLANRKCPDEIAHLIYANAANSSSLDVGMDKRAVYRHMGVPQRLNSVRLTDGRTVEILLYRVGHPSCLGGAPMDAEFLPVIVHQGTVTGYGDAFYKTMIAPLQYQATAEPVPQAQQPVQPAPYGYGYSVAPQQQQQQPMIYWYPQQ